MTAAEKGAYCEQCAREYLRRQGYRIEAVNFRCKGGEIDIVALDKDELVFVEVKARKSTGFGAPCEAVTYTKRRKIMRAAQLYLARCKREYGVRFDVIEVLFDERADKICIRKINQIRAAFGEGY